MDIVGGEWLTQVDEEEGLKQFKSRYKICPYQMIVDYQIFHITRLFPKEIQHVVFLEYDGDINCIMSLEPNEHLMVYSNGCMAHENRVFNTDGMAFIKLIRDSKKVAMWVVEDSPYDLTAEEWEEDMYDGITHEEALQLVKEELKDNDVHKEVNKSNVLFVRQL